MTGRMDEARLPFAAYARAPHKNLRTGTSGGTDCVVGRSLLSALLLHLRGDARRRKTAGDVLSRAIRHRVGPRSIRSSTHGHWIDKDEAVKVAGHGARPKALSVAPAGTIPQTERTEQSLYMHRDFDLNLLENPYELISGVQRPELGWTTL